MISILTHIHSEAIEKSLAIAELSPHKLNHFADEQKDEQYGDTDLNKVVDIEQGGKVAHLVIPIGAGCRKHINSQIITTRVKRWTYQ